MGAKAAKRSEAAPPLIGHPLPVRCAGVPETKLDR
jgi:hypothetical protein